MEVTNKYVALKHWIDRTPVESDFELKESMLTLTVEEGSNGVVVRNLYLSIDPYQMNRMKSSSSSHKVIKNTSRIVPGQIIEAHGVGKVVASDDDRFKEGDMVVGLLGWEEYSVIGDANMLRKIESSEFPPSYHLGILGTSGQTAYAGFYDLCKPKKGEKVFVSAASGSVGNVVGQFAKLLGCYVVGCAGTDQKVDLLKSKLGFDDAFNYKKESDLKSTLQRYFPNGIDIYFDNVGGEMLEAAIVNMNIFGRVAVCGVISEYTDGKMRGAPDMLEVVYKRITIQGFLIVDYMHLIDDFISLFSEHLRHGRMFALEDISKGLENIPSAFVGLFRGDNIGKKLVQVSG